MTSSVSDLTFLREGDCFENKVAWLMMEIINQAVRDAAKGINLGIVNRRTFKPIHGKATCDEMTFFQDGAIWLQSETCEEVCASLRAWSNFRIQFNRHKFVKLARVLADKTKTQTNKRFIQG